MIKRWLAKRFRNNDAAKDTLTAICGGSGALVLLAVCAMLAWERWLK